MDSKVEDSDGFVVEFNALASGDVTGKQCKGTPRPCYSLQGLTGPRSIPQLSVPQGNGCSVGNS